MYDALIDDQAAWFERNMSKVLTTLQKRIEAYVNDFQSAKGILLDTDLNSQMAYQSYASLTELLRESGYFQLVEAAQAKESDIIRYMRNNRPKGAIPLAFTAATAEKLKGLSAVYAANYGSVAAQQMRGIQGIIVNSVTGGLNANDAIKQIRDVVEDKLKRYATTYFNTTRNKFIQAVEYANAAQTEGETYWEYFGPDDNVTRPACQEGLEIGYFTDAERIEFESQIADERAYNCRHGFVQITREYYNDHTGGDK